MSGISLTASMRSNLLSLQNISGQVSSTQNKLATGNKVNSAIDNPSSYYTALSLNNRADDLNALLDSMGQAVSTIKAATTALESAAGFLEQASAVATQALETAKIPSKSFFEEKVGENGAVVSTAQELRDAIAAGKETICVYGAIDLGDISASDGLELKENQKLVGVGYFGNFDTDTNKFSSISATANTVKNLISITQNGCEVSDLSISYENSALSGSSFAIYVSGTNVEADIGNVDIYADFSNSTDNKAAIASFYGAVSNIKNSINIQTSGQYGGGIYSNTNGIVNINSGAEINIQNSDEYGRGIYSNINGLVNINSGAKINIQTAGSSGHGIFVYSSSRCNINSGAEINIQTSGNYGVGVLSTTNATVNISSNAKIDIKTSGPSGHGLSMYANGIVNINSGAEVNIQTSGQSGHGVYIYNSGICNIAGNVRVKAEKSYGFTLASESGNTVNILSTAQIYFNTGSAEIYNRYDGGQGPNILNVSAGAKLAFEKDGKTNWYEVRKDGSDKNTSSTTENIISANNIKDKLSVEETSAWELPEKMEMDFGEDASDGEVSKQDLTETSKQYQEIINQYDALIKDAGYKGINLLQTDKLSVKFNETNTADLSVQGKDMSSKALGFTVFDWQTQGDIAESLSEIASALKSIRNYSAELGNNYSIITTRQDFTESLVNVLTEGADKLTLADMNEESANMLALQTRQQLAINSLSLASQASQSILKLF